MTRFCPVAPGDNLSKMLESMIGSWSWSAPTRIVIESGEEGEESSGGMLEEGEELPSESPESLICAKHAGYTWVSEKKRNSSRTVFGHACHAYGTYRTTIAHIGSTHEGRM